MTEYAGVVAAGLILAAIGVAWLWHTSARPSIIERLERSMVSNQSRLDGQEAEIDDLRRRIAELREGRIADHALLQEWITYARRLGELLRAATGQEPPPEPQTQLRNVSADRSQLARHIAARFSLSEIDGLAFELGMDGQVNGDTVEARAISLVAVAQRRGLLLRLVELCRRERPNGGF